MSTLILLAGLFSALAAVLHVWSILVVIARVRNATLGPASEARVCSDYIESVLRFFVMRGLDPRIHLLTKMLDGRVKPGHDERVEFNLNGKRPNDGVTIVRPMCGIENFSDETIASSFHLRHSRYEILFCVADSGDPVIPLVQRLIAAHPGISSRLLVGNNPISTNPKLNNTVKGWLAAQYPWVVMADSNVLMPPDCLAQLFAAWRGDTGLVCSPPVGLAPHGIWAELECAVLNTYQIRWQSFADSVGLGFAQGKTMLWRKEILEKGGGIRALAAELAEDAAATRLVRSQGLRVRLVDRPFEQPLGHRTAAEVWLRQLRWARLRRDTFKLYFVPELLSGGIPPLAASAAGALAIDVPVTATVALFAVVWYGAEVLLARAAGWYYSWRSPFLFVVRDLLLPVLWLASWAGDEFVWRGNSMRVANPGSPA